MVAIGQGLQSLNEAVYEPLQFKVELSTRKVGICNM